ncbi:MAG: hypothetical protein NTX36_13520 [Proteobacteria bacterium]|nr:hypothetical protein [Pseudomonadota bacterium]
MKEVLKLHENGCLPVIRSGIGGFGVGSEFTWNTVGYFGYRFTTSITGLLGYQALMDAVLWAIINKR